MLKAIKMKLSSIYFINFISARHHERYWVSYMQVQFLNVSHIVFKKHRALFCKGPTELRY
jgi:hypothetical protein